MIGLYSMDERTRCEITSSKGMDCLMATKDTVKLRQNIIITSILKMIAA